MKPPIVIDNFLPADTFKRVQALAATAPWKYGAKSHHNNDPHGHLSWKPYHDAVENLADIGNFVSEDALREVWRLLAGRPEIGTDIRGSQKLIRLYYNSYTYGMDGYFHRDSTRPGETTVILFLCDQWAPDWAGESVVTTDDWKQQWSTLPYPNRAVIFDSNMLHCGRGVSRVCTIARTVLVLKMRPERSVPYEMLSQWLVAKGALRLGHSQGTLHDHLVRVFAMLERKNLPLHLCLAGGLHSIYGTNSFLQRLVAPDDTGRNKVRDRFGYEAERLAFAFGQLKQRPQSLEDSVFDNGTVYPANPDVGDLCRIEAANLADQDSLDKWPKLKKLWEST